MGHSHSVEYRESPELLAALKRSNEVIVELQKQNALQLESVREMQEDIKRSREEFLATQRQSQNEEEEKKKLEEWARKLEEDANKRVERESCLREEAERNLAKGIPPVKYPTAQDIQAVRERLEYHAGNIHLAITGRSGSGKSSLVNAFRGLPDNKAGSAAIGTEETTTVIGRYGDASRPWMFWYDVPGAGTLSIPHWQYFNDQGLFIFDILIIVIDIRFTETDIALLFNCKRFGIPAFVVRSKADQHIENIIKSEDDDDDDEGDRESIRKSAREKFVINTREQFKSVFIDAGLPPQKVYIVTNRIIRRIVKGSIPNDIIDEVQLINDIVYAANQGFLKNQPQ